jgi:hypothetical protein
MAPALAGPRPAERELAALGFDEGGLLPLGGDLFQDE